MTPTTPKLVVDTNIVVSAALIGGSMPALALDLALAKFTLLRSDDTFAELEEVLSRAKFDRYKAHETRAAFLESLLDLAERISVTEEIRACRHPKDNKFLEFAVSGKADYILSGDQDLLVLNPFRGIKILAPTEFLARFGT